MDIVLWRHAEAEDFSNTDNARRLTPKGERQAANVAAWLESHLGDHAQRTKQWRVIASPALRTQQTAGALGMLVETIEDIAPGASVETLLHAADWPNGARNVIVVGHQPTLGMVVGRLINGVDRGVSVKKGAAWWFRGRERDGVSKVVLVAMVTPDTVGESS